MQAVVVEPADPFDDRELEVLETGPVAAGDELGLERVDDALGERVVVGVAGRADRRQDAVIVNALTSAGLRRSPWRKTPRRPSGSRWPCATRGLRAPDPSGGRAQQS